MSTTEDEVRDLFSEFGAVQSVDLIVDRETGRLKGFGFVEMPNYDEARSAINGLDDSEYSELHGKELRVREAKPEDREDRHGHDDYGGYGGRHKHGGYGGR